MKDFDLDAEYRENIRNILKTVKSIKGILIFFLLIIVFQLFWQSLSLINTFRLNDLRFVVLVDT